MLCRDELYFKLLLILHCTQFTLYAIYTIRNLLLRVSVTLRNHLQGLYINYQLDALIIIYS